MDYAARRKSEMNCCQAVLVAFADKLGAEEAYIIHMSHHVGLHAEEAAKLPPHRHLAYDGMQFSIEF